MDSKDLKTITIHQGQGDDELEMTVQVTHAEFDKMEEIRSKDPLFWNGKELDLVKAAKETIRKEPSGECIRPSKQLNWKLLIGVVLGIVIIAGTIIFAESKNKKSIEASAQSAKPKEIDKKVINEANRGELLYAYLKKNGFIASGSKEDFLAYIEDEERRMTLYEEMNDLGIFSQDDFYSNFGQRKYIIGWYSDFCTFLGYPYYNHPQPKTENMEKTYNKLSKLGSKGSFEEFIEYFEESDDNKKKVYEKLKDNGYLGTYDDFLEYVGYTSNMPINENDYIHYLWQVASQNGYKRDEKYLRNELKSNNEYKQLFYEKMVSEGCDIGSWEEFSNKVDDQTLIDFIFVGNQNTLDLYNVLCEKGAVNGSYEQVLQWLDDAENRANLYKKLFEKGAITGSQSDFDSWLGFGNNSNISARVDFDKIRQSSSNTKSSELKVYSSKQYGFTYQYDKKEFDLVEKTNKNTHCVMKLQSPKDEIKSILVSVWENSDFSSAYDPDFMESCQSVDQGLGSVIRSATKTKVGGVNALKSELKINPMGKSYYAAIYRIIHKKRMYMLNIYIPIEEYNKDKSYGDKCANNFKFN